MTEISARDLRRLEALEGRFQKAEDDRKALRAERSELRTAVTANARQARAAEKQVADAEAKLEPLLAQNASLAARLDEVTADLERLQGASTELRTQLDATRAELEKAQKSRAALERELTAAKADRDGLEKSLELAREQLAGKSIAPVVPAKDVAKLVDGLVSELGAGLPGLAVRDGEVRLHVAFGKVGRTSGFVVPSPDSPPEIRESLHEVAIRFDRTFEPPPGR